MHLFSKPINQLQTNHRVRPTHSPQTGSCTLPCLPRVRTSLARHLPWRDTTPPPLVRAVSMQGVYVLHDHSFRWLQYVAGDSAASTRDAALRHCVFPCGLLRGALGALGVRAVVRADIPSADKLPYCAWRLRIAALAWCCAHPGPLVSTSAAWCVQAPFTFASRQTLPQRRRAQCRAVTVPEARLPVQWLCVLAAKRRHALSFAACARAPL